VPPPPPLHVHNALSYSRRLPDSFSFMVPARPGDGLPLLPLPRPPPAPLPVAPPRPLGPPFPVGPPRPLGPPPVIPQRPVVIPQRPLVIPQRPLVIPQRPLVITRPYPEAQGGFRRYPEAQGGFRPYPEAQGGFRPINRPASLPEQPHVTRPKHKPNTDIRSFYDAATMLGRGRLVLDGSLHNVQMVCDFGLAGISSTTHVLTDVVWQKIGRSAYLNSPSTSASTYPNSLYCRTDYIAPRQTNYSFSIQGSKTTLTIKNATTSDYGTYRCYATRVSRFNPRQRLGVFMEVYYSPSDAASHHIKPRVPASG